ncbi:MAG: FGGY-family carbohydrate kinase [Proteobacteria bacterium]|nr:FGGY-family carbohydrate kinase [Pseudomonadota bacterium]
MLGDQQAALAGQTCFGVGEAKCTYGTGAFLLMNTGKESVLSKSGLLTTVAWGLKGELTYALEGSCFIAGAAIQFLRDQLKFLAKSDESEAMASQVEASPNLYFVPALSGLGAPYWDPKARGAFLGLHRGSTTNEIVRASLEGIGFQVMDLTRSMTGDLGRALSVLRVDGGAAKNNLLMQFQADLIEAPVDRPANIETTAMGAALFSALGVGIFSDLDQLKSARVQDRLFSPCSNLTEKASLILKKKGWAKAVQAVQLFAKE